MRYTIEYAQEAIIKYEKMVSWLDPSHPMSIEAQEVIERLHRTIELMNDGMEYWEAYVKARMEQGHDH